MAAKKKSKKKPKPAKKTPKKSSKKAAKGPSKTRGVPTYGVLRGVVVAHGREDDPDTPHLQLIVVANGERWRCAINVLSSDDKATPDEKEVRFIILDPLTSHPILSRLAGLSAGFTRLPERRSGQTLDFVREPFFAFQDMQHLPFAAPGVGNDLQDLMEVYVNKAEGKPAAEAEVFVWGSKFSGGTPRPADVKFNTRQGVHNVHMNQGNPLDPVNPNKDHFEDNGVFQDGGVIFKLSNPDRFVGVFLKFESQATQTDDQTGAPLGVPAIPPPVQPAQPGQPAVPVPPTAPPALPAQPSVAIVAALVNPEGEEIGNETVTLLNTLSQPVNLAGWRIEDRDGNGDPLDGVQLRGGEARTIVLTGAGARLGNNGGAISLRNREGLRVHSVTYSAEDAAEQGRTIIF